MFVEIVHSPANITLLKTFNAERYASLSIAQGQTNGVIAQVGALIKSKTGPFAAYASSTTTLMGTSASSGTVRNYLRARGPADARRRADLRRLPADQHQRQHAAADRRRPDDPDADADGGDDVGARGIAYRRPDSDAPGNRFRLYEVAGMPHNNSRDSPAFLTTRARCRSPISPPGRSRRWR